MHSFNNRTSWQLQTRGVAKRCTHAQTDLQFVGMVDCILQARMEKNYSRTSIIQMSFTEFESSITGVNLQTLKVQETKRRPTGNNWTSKL